MSIDRVQADLATVPRFLGDGLWALSEALDVVARRDDGRWADMAELVIRGKRGCKTLHDFEKASTREQILARIADLTGMRA